MEDECGHGGEEADAGGEGGKAGLEQAGEDMGTLALAAADDGHRKGRVGVDEDMPCGSVIMNTSELAQKGGLRKLRSKGGVPEGEFGVAIWLASFEKIAHNIGVETGFS